MKDEKLQTALKQFAQIVPQNVLKKMLDDIVPAKNEVAGVGLAAIAANPKYIGILIRKIASFLQEVTGIDIDKIPYIDKALYKPSDFFNILLKSMNINSKLNENLQIYHQRNRTYTILKIPDNGPQWATQQHSMVV